MHSKPNEDKDEEKTNQNTYIILGEEDEKEDEVEESEREEDDKSTYKSTPADKENVTYDVNEMSVEEMENVLKEQKEKDVKRV